MRAERRRDRARYFCPGFPCFLFFPHPSSLIPHPFLDWNGIMRRSLLTLALVALGYLPLSSQAAKVKVWHQHKPGDFDKARLQQVVVSNEGVLRLSRELK